jgi:hypothetical protein
MRKFIVGLILGSLLVNGISYAYRIPKPQRITGFDQNGLVILNETLEQLWDVTNGRYSLNTTTTNPDGSLQGNGGDMILLNTGGNYYLEINTTGAKVWRGILLSNTP